jgi:hypothetical protein
MTLILWVLQEIVCDGSGLDDLLSKAKAKAETATNP